MDGFELVMTHGHADQRVQIGLLMQEALPVGQQVTQMRLALRRRVDHLARAVLDQLRARRAPDVHVRAFQGAAHLHGGDGAQRPLLERQKAAVQGGAVAQRFLRRGVSGVRTCGAVGVLE